MHAYLNAHSLKIHACTKVNKSFELPFVRPKGPTVIQQLRERDPKTTSATPLIVSHSSGLSLAYLEASVYAELLPPSGSTWLLVHPSVSLSLFLSLCPLIYVPSFRSVYEPVTQSPSRPCPPLDRISCCRCDVAQLVWWRRRSVAALRLNHGPPCLAGGTARQGRAVTGRAFEHTRLGGARYG